MFTTENEIIRSSLKAEIQAIKIKYIYQTRYFKLENCKNRVQIESRLLTQSICTHYSRFENMGRFATLKKSGPKYGPELFAFWITIILVFRTLLLSGPYFGPDFFKYQTLKIIRSPDKLDIRVQIDWASEYCHFVLARFSWNMFNSEDIYLYYLSFLLRWNSNSCPYHSVHF